MEAQVSDRAHILIVDDVPANVVVLGNALADAYEVRFATSGAEALELAERAPPDLILLDVMMPGMSGHEMHRRLRQHANPVLRDVAVIFVTADTSLGSELAGFKLGAEDYITKPIVVPILLARVRNVLERSRRRRDLELSLASAEQGLWEWRPEQDDVMFNANWAIPLGYARGEMAPCVMSWRQLVHPDDWPVLFAARDTYFSGETRLFDPELRMRHKDDTYVWMQLHGKAVEFDASGRPLKMMGTYMNISRRKHAEFELRRREAQLATMIASLQDAVLVLDREGRITMCHVPQDSRLGFLSAELVGQQYDAALPPEAAQQLARAIAAAIDCQCTVQQEFDLEQDGNRCSLQLTLNALAGSDQDPTGYLAVLQDITPHKRAEEEIRALAFYDQLTRLPNQRMLRDRLRAALAFGAHTRNTGALMFLDLDNFRRLEQAQGRSVGDLVLVETARRIEQAVGDAGMVARLGGDKFLILLEGLGASQAEAAQRTAGIGERVMAAVDRTLEVADQQYRVSVSIGVTLFSGQRLGEDAMLQQVEMAMYSAKASPGNALRFFDPEMQASAMTRVALEQALYKGLERGEFFLAYQPQVDSTCRIIGAEALVRWRHPEKGVLAPGDFIPLAEDTGLIVPLGQRILEQACRQLRLWQANPATAHLTLAVNVSSRQFERGGFVEEIELLLQSSGIDARLLKLEITESLLLENTDSIVRKMQRLREIGVSISLDDFGTGYSSLAYLKKLPIDQLKIDQSFVRNAVDSNIDAAIIRAIMTLGNSLGIPVIAEGVETAAELDFLVNQGCTLYQGYFFGKPCEVSDFEALPALSAAMVSE
ncbi:EAL domain-containing protein [Janthinobacterium sp. 17J80-10]|uniref:GGDEF/EAL domain-containing response regulator n=1 Tax=Janthinobacterium sp. 17J80-10 TaxID=2497863 RepID=UPI001005659F|nr:EAL domain-containing protein [Janthinobacterium sp. 17J80-10]QAU32780.1 EAL domain-containing protein [Janthinobacterium sp. 17J80-10]